MVKRHLIDLQKSKVYDLERLFASQVTSMGISQRGLTRSGFPVTKQQVYWLRYIQVLIY